MGRFLGHRKRLLQGWVRLFLRYNRNSSRGWQECPFLAKHILLPINGEQNCLDITACLWNLVTSWGWWKWPDQHLPPKYRPARPSLLLPPNFKGKTDKTDDSLMRNTNGQYIDNTRQVKKNLWQELLARMWLKQRYLFHRQWECYLFLEK